MAFKLKKVRKINPANPEEAKWYLVQERSGSVNLSEIAKEVAHRAALSEGDVQSVLTNLMNTLPLFIKLGQSVNLTGFGSFHLSVTSVGTDMPEDLTTHNVKGARLLFTPSVELKRNLEGISFEIENALYDEHQLTAEERQALNEQ
jgi:predicted histone-like DNA-binding protein